MHEVAARAPGFWRTVSEHVTTKVADVRNRGSAERAPVVAYLRDMEAAARRECRCRDTIQIIASGRHLLGDREDVRPMEASSRGARSNRSFAPREYLARS